VIYYSIMLSQSPLWTLEELGARVALALADGYGGQADGRVRDVPDARTIRYYTTLGLIDRPAAMRGRTALYGPRHLLQLVAIKRLQSQGLTLAEVQQQLLGRTEAALRELARVPAEVLSGVGSPPTDGTEEAQREAFWKQTPQPQEGMSTKTAPAALAWTGMPLAEGVTLLWQSARPPEEHDVEALRAAAAPLLKLLRARRLVGRPGDDSHTEGRAP
jgi:DNA-binding transcriptional MerR regulator